MDMDLACQKFLALKIRIAEGIEFRCYQNSLVEIGLSELGCYFEVYNFPYTDLGGSLNNYQARFINYQEAEDVWQMAIKIHQQAETYHFFQFLAIYTLEDFFGQIVCPERNIKLGVFQDQLPLYFHLLLESREPITMLDNTRRGEIIFCQNLTDQHFLLKIPKIDFSHHSPAH